MEHAVHEEDEEQIAALKAMNGALFEEVLMTKMQDDELVRRASQVQSYCTLHAPSVCALDSHGPRTPSH
jgi:hypothetical protein